jgi:hypothetical protein
METRNWIEDICKEVNFVRAANPGEKITIQVSPLMMDYLKLLFENSMVTQKFRQKAKEINKETPNLLFGYPLEVVDFYTTCTFYVHSEKE